MATAKTKSTTKAKTTRSTSKATVSSKRISRPSSKTVINTELSKTASSKSSYRESFSNTLKRYNIKTSQAVVVLGVLLVVALLIYFRGFFVVATVNGKPIDRLTYMKEVEGIYVSEARTTAGKQALNQLVTKTLLRQEAEKKNITVSEKEINDEVAKTKKSLEAQGQNLDSALAMQGDTLENYKERIQLQKLLEKLVGEIKVSDKEVAEYIEKNKDSIPTDLKESDIKSQAQEAIKQERFNTKVQELIQNLQKNAKISYPKA